jgi:hypothetical protein
VAGYLSDACALLAARDICKAVRGHQAVAPTKARPVVRAGEWLAGWIPFAATGSGDYLCIDRRSLV